MILSTQLKLRDIYNIETTPYAPIKHPDKTPDINDPNNYYISCEKQLKTRTTYCQHWNMAHQVVFSNASLEQSLHQMQALFIQTE
jgi:hypothetical protein